MKIVGIIVEYNPLHNGHVYHISKIKEIANPDIIVAVMSGNFTMRGDLSLFDKFEKTNQALENGIDVVIELPSILAVNNADIFAAKAVELLNMFSVQEIYIGSEKNDSEIYKEYYNIVNSKEYNILVKKYLQEGESYKKANLIAANDLLLPELKSNDMLGLAYYTAIIKNNYKMCLKTIKRVGDDYNSTKTKDDKFTSATAIRANLDKAYIYTPKYVFDNFNTYKINDLDDMFVYLKYQIMNMTAEELEEIFLCDEGIQNLFKKIIVTTYSLTDFLNEMTSKRYTKSRIKRICFYILFNIKKIDMVKVITSPLDSTRVLGYSTSGKKYINTIKKNINIYTNIKEGINYIYDTELKITKILDFIYLKDNLIKEQNSPIEKAITTNL